MLVISGWSVLVVVVVTCCCIPYRLVLMLAPTFASYIYTSCPLDLVLVVFPFFPTSANILFAQVVVVTSCNVVLFHSVTSAQIVHLHTWYGGISLCNLRWWCFFIQPLVKILHLHPGDLHCVVVIILYYTFI